jgi:hypothetical protein
MKKNNKNDKIKNGKKKEVIDLTSFITPDSVKVDPYGSYTGTTASTFYGEELEEPVQDADDL